MFEHARAIRAALARWYDRGHRPLPWRATRDPYRIWVSEIMLQQTRATAAIPYYERFLARFPDVATLAAAPEQDVLAAWAGLGYYSRARNLHKAAQRIVAEHGGEFPSTYEAIRGLPGIGDYTAAAIASISFGLSHAVVDGNVLRVLSRITAEPGEIRATATRARLREAADALLDPRHPARSNQALMELGATVCSPRNPQCPECPAQRWCAARAAGNPATFPVQTNYKILVESADTVVIIEERKRLRVRQRDRRESRMAGFWELPDAASLEGLRDPAVVGSFRHTIVNHRYEITVLTGNLSGEPPAGYRWLDGQALSAVPLTTVSRKALALARKNQQQGFYLS